MQSRIDRDLVLSVLRMAIWRGEPTKPVLIRSDQGCEFFIKDWQAFLKESDPAGSMSCRGNCHGNLVAEGFFRLLKRERIRRGTYNTRESRAGRCVWLHQDVL